jgi:hypothetical protein
MSCYHICTPHVALVSQMLLSRLLCLIDELLGLGCVAHMFTHMVCSCAGNICVQELTQVGKARHEWATSRHRLTQADMGWHGIYNMLCISG